VQTPRPKKNSENNAMGGDRWSIGEAPESPPVAIASPLYRRPDTTWPLAWAGGGVHAAVGLAVPTTVVVP